MAELDQPVPNDARDDESGRFEEKYPTEDFIGALRDAGGMAGTGEIAGSVGCGHDTAYKRLHQLEERGYVSKRNVGNTLLWRLLEDD